MAVVRWREGDRTAAYCSVTVILNGISHAPAGLPFNRSTAASPACATVVPGTVAITHCLAPDTCEAVTVTSVEHWFSIPLQGEGAPKWRLNLSAPNQAHASRVVPIGVS